MESKGLDVVTRQTMEEKKEDYIGWTQQEYGDGISCCESFVELKEYYLVHDEAERIKGYKTYVYTFKMADASDLKKAIFHNEKAKGTNILYFDFKTDEGKKNALMLANRSEYEKNYGSLQDYEEFCF